MRSFYIYAENGDYSLQDVSLALDAGDSTYTNAQEFNYPPNNPLTY